MTDFPPRFVIDGGLLSLWGIAVLLCWVALTRLVYHLHLEAANRGWLSAPLPMLPMEKWSDAGVTFAALACGFSALIAFSSSVAVVLTVPEWFEHIAGSTWAALFRILCAYLVLIFFLTRVAEHPRYKLKWALCWSVFAMAVAAWS